MNHNVDAPRGCERSEELLAYLYNEAGAGERERFERHMTACAACREEYAAFRGVREAIISWREQTLAAARPVALPHVASSPRFATERSAEKRSALVAMREFLRLAPVWMQASGAVAALIVCALAAFALVDADLRLGRDGIAFSTGLRKQQRAAAPDAQTPPRYSQQEVDEMVAERVRRGIEDFKRQNAGAGELAAATGGRETGVKSPARNTEASFTAPSDPDRNVRRRNRASILASALRERQAALARRSDQDVPRLSDLLDVVN